MRQNYEALAKAVRKRREELGYSRHKAWQLSKRYDVECYPDEAAKNPGVSTTTWQGIELAEEANRRAHTLELVDAVLRWPPGTAMSYATGKDHPEGAPVSLPSENNGQGAEDEAATRVEISRSRREVAELREEVAVLHAKVESFAKAIKRLTDAVEGR